MNEALRRIGFDLIFDTNFSADLTIMEEATEFLERLKTGKNLPLFTSCCPAWVKYLEDQHPDMLPHLSSCKSPMSMLSPVLVELVPKHFNIERENLVVVAIMPCTAKKYECKRSELSHNGRPDTDYVLTTQELGRMIREAGIDFTALKGEDADDMLQTVKDISHLPFDAIKIHMLHIIKDTKMALEYIQEPFPLLSMNEYIDIVIKQLELLDPKVIIERLTGDPIEEELIAPLWTLNKIAVLNGIDKRMAELNTYQGKYYEDNHF